MIFKSNKTFYVKGTVYSTRILLIFRIRISTHACLNKAVCNSANHRLLQHGNRHTRRERVAYASLRPAETFMRAYLRPREAARFCVRKCANNRLLIVAGIQRFARYAYAARFRVIYTRKALHALRTFTQTVIGIFFLHRNGHTRACVSYTMLKSVLL